MECFICLDPDVEENLIEKVDPSTASSKELISSVTALLLLAPNSSKDDSGSGSSGSSGSQSINFLLKRLCYKCIINILEAHQYFEQLIFIQDKLHTLQIQFSHELQIPIEINSEDTKSEETKKTKLKNMRKKILNGLETKLNNNVENETVSFVDEGGTSCKPSPSSAAAGDNEMEVSREYSDDDEDQFLGQENLNSDASASDAPIHSTNPSPYTEAEGEASEPTSDNFSDLIVIPPDYSSNLSKSISTSETVSPEKSTKSNNIIVRSTNIENGSTNNISVTKNKVKQKKKRRQELKWMCRECVVPCRFSRQERLEMHMKRIHEGIACPYKCPECNDSFKTSSQRKHHQKSHIRKDLLSSYNQRQHKLNNRHQNIKLIDLSVRLERFDEYRFNKVITKPMILEEIEIVEFKLEPDPE